MHWSIPLGAPPDVAAIGRNAHGFEPMDRYCLPDLWSLHLYGYEAKLRIDDLPFDIRPGCLGLTPPGRTMETRYFGISVHIYVHFRLLDEGPTRQVLAMQDLGDRYDMVYGRLYELVGSFADEPLRANARLWDLLWDLSSTPPSSQGLAQIHPAVLKATNLIPRNLSTPISVEALAQEVGVSYSYLARLFQEAHGETVVEFVRNRRLERAKHLLERSTLPIKAIAASVGMPDLQHFNKALRARFGVGPRGIRSGIKTAVPQGASTAGLEEQEC